MCAAQTVRRGGVCIHAIHAASNRATRLAGTELSGLSLHAACVLVSYCTLASRQVQKRRVPARLRTHLTQEFRSVVSQCTMFSQRNRELHKAIKEGNYAQVIQCLDVGPKRERAKVDQADRTGWLPLARAADYGHTRICAALLDRGAAVDQSCAKYGHNLTPLYLACNSNRFETAELLVARGANMEFVSRANGYAPLHVACHAGHINLVQLLLDHGADIKRASRNGHKPLSIASGNGHVDVVELMFDRDVDSYHELDDLRQTEGSTAMATACHQGAIDVVRCLLARGVVVTYRSRAIAQSKPGIKALLDAAAPPEKRQLAHWINRIHLHAVGPRGDHQGSARHQLLNCQHLARHLVSFLLVK